MKFNRKRKSDYYCGTISFLALRALILSWSTTWNRRKGKFSEFFFFFFNWTKKRMNSNHHIIKDGNEVEAQWDPTLGEEKFSPNATHTHTHTHTYVYICMYVCMYIYVYVYVYISLLLVSIMHRIKEEATYQKPQLQPFLNAKPNGPSLFFSFLVTIWNNV